MDKPEGGPMNEENSKEISTLCASPEGEQVGQDITGELEGSKSVSKRKRGRPPGAKNKDTIFKELMRGDFQDLATTEVKKVFQVLFEQAQAGDMQAIKMVMDRVVPQSKAVDLADMEKGGISISINVGALEDVVEERDEPIEGEFTEMEE